MTRPQFVVTGLAILALAGGAAAATDPIISEYVEGSSNNKAIEIYNGTGEPVTMDRYRLDVYFNGSATPTSLAFNPVVVPHGGVFIFAAGNAGAEILAQADQTTAVGLWNGDDAIVLRRVADSAVVDAIGQVGVDPGSEWGAGLTSTADNTLRRLPGICEGRLNAMLPFDPALEWGGYALDVFDGLGAHVTTCEPIALESASWSGLKATYR